MGDMRVPSTEVARRHMYILPPEQTSGIAICEVQYMRRCQEQNKNIISSPIGNVK